MSPASWSLPSLGMRCDIARAAADTSRPVRTLNACAPYAFQGSSRSDATTLLEVVCPIWPTPSEAWAVSQVRLKFGRTRQKSIWDLPKFGRGQAKCGRPRSTSEVVAVARVWQRCVAARPSLAKNCRSRPNNDRSRSQYGGFRADLAVELVPNFIDFGTTPTCSSAVDPFRPDFGREFGPDSTTSERIRPRSARSGQDRLVRGRVGLRWC